MKRMWIREKWHDARSTRRLMAYLTRRRTMIPQPRWDVFGDVSERYLLRRTPNRTKPIKNTVFELVTYIETLGEMSTVWGYLEQRLRRPINCYCHFDEGADHAHFVCRAADDEGRALRLGRMDLAEMNARIAFLLGRTLSPKGTGREQLSLRELRANPQGLSVCKSRFQDAIAAIDTLMALYAGYQSIRIGAKSNGAVRTIQEIDPARSTRDQLLYRRLKNLAGTGSEIVFSPVGSPRATIKPLYLNRVPARHLNRIPAGSAIVAIAGTHQAHIPVLTPLTSSGVATIQRILCAKLETDRESVSPGQWRHLPGFHGVHIRTDVMPHGVSVSILALVDELKEQRRIQAAAGARTKHVQTQRTWRDFWRPDRDKADLDYAVYLMEAGCSVKDIRAEIISESEDLVLRKGIGMSRYLDSVTKMAKQRVVTAQPTKSMDQLLQVG